ncbi:MAG: HAMP domain-containing sensor histidine kinase [Leptolyngbyaceae bacterium]|nr:HAMP domain-containing sensor histidine kinase [Leptolyngbyaceae bacterium]
MTLSPRNDSSRFSHPTVGHPPTDSWGSTAEPLNSPQRAAAFVSLRVKLLVGFSLIFSVVFAGAFLWFYNFTTDKTISRLRADLKSTLEGAVEGVDVDELISLYQEGKPNEEGFSDDPRYLNQLEWFATVKSIEPRAWLYSFIVIGPEELEGQPPLSREAINPIPLDQYQTIWLVDLWANYPEYRDQRAAKFLYKDRRTSSISVLVKYQQRVVEEEQIYQDDWGTWLSAFAPLKNDEGQVVAILGLDIEADYVFKLQDEIRQRVLLSFVITYGILFVLIYVLSGVLTKHLTDLTRSAERIAAGNYRQSLYLARLNRSSKIREPVARHPWLMRVFSVGQGIRRYLRDEMSILAQAFEVMIDSIQTRERMIREGKAKEDKMRRDLEVARELNALKSRFVSIVSHEFRTPLTVLRTSTELLEKYGHLASDSKKQAYYQRIRAAISNMTQLLEDVLVVGQSDAGKLEFKPIAIEVETFCRNLCDDMQHSVGLDHTIQFSYEDRRSSPKMVSDEGNQVHLDPNLLRPILSNLLSNAIKYSKPKTVVSILTVLNDDNVVFEVKDQGIGIPKEDQPHLFELFHRASNVEAIRGTGLGLSIVKQCSDRHNGKISFVSQEDVGTTFTVRLPIVTPSEALTIPLDSPTPILGKHPEVNESGDGYGHTSNRPQSGVSSGAIAESAIARKPHN